MFQGSRKIIEQILDKADVRINGSRSFDIKVNDERFYDRVVLDGTLGVGESYMDGWWDSDQLDETVFRVIRAGGEENFVKSLPNLFNVLKSKVINLQNKKGSLKVAKEHYDLGNDLYFAFLDPYKQYTCGYFKDTDDLNKAQEQKLDLICQKLQLKKGDRVLDIGCGWGGFAKWAAKNYEVNVTGINISEEQIAFAKEFTKGLSVEIVNSDYRDIRGQYDKVVSVGMFEHVGYKNYKGYFEVVKRILKPDGLFLLHTIGQDSSKIIAEPWIEKYIFPNSMIPSVSQIGKAGDKLFIVEDWHNFGQYYDPTLMAWYSNFEKSWPKLKDKYGDRFFRMFRYYLLSCAGAFRARDLNLWQIVFSHKGVVGGYKSIR